MNCKLVAIDLAKNVFQLHGVDEKGNKVLEKRLQRDKLCAFIAQLPPCQIVTETCGSSNYWGRKFQSLGHEVKLINAEYVKPFVRRNKNDKNDSKAIAEAAMCAEMHFVPVKSVEQQDIQSLHRIRSRLIHDRTALTNQIRGLLAEYGIVFPQTLTKLRILLPALLAGTVNELSQLAKEFFADLYEQFKAIDEKIAYYDKKLEVIFKTNEDCQRLSTLPGVGVLVATAFVASVGNIQFFKNGRHLSAWMGLIPKQHSSGNKQRLLGISKRGDCYLRTLFIHGARSITLRCHTKQDNHSEWLTNKVVTAGYNKATVAWANKMARMAWALLTKQENYQVASRQIPQVAN